MAFGGNFQVSGEAVVLRRRRQRANNTVSTGAPPPGQPNAPDGYAYLIGPDGQYLQGADGNYLLGPIVGS